MKVELLINPYDGAEIRLDMTEREFLALWDLVAIIAKGYGPIDHDRKRAKEIDDQLRRYFHVP